MNIVGLGFGQRPFFCHQRLLLRDQLSGLLKLERQLARVVHWQILRPPRSVVGVDGRVRPVLALGDEQVDEITGNPHVVSGRQLDSQAPRQGGRFLVLLQVCLDRIECAIAHDDLAVRAVGFGADRPSIDEQVERGVVAPAQLPKPKALEVGDAPGAILAPSVWVGPQSMVPPVEAQIVSLRAEPH